MRTDCKIDNRKIPAPNQSFLCGSRGAAKAGDCILYRERRNDGSYRVRLARVLGRVSADAVQIGDKPTKGYALVMALSDDGTAGYERWIDPVDIAQVFDSPAKFAAFFFGPLQYDVHIMRRLMEYGTINERFIDGAPDVVAAWSVNKVAHAGPENT